MNSCDRREASKNKTEEQKIRKRFAKEKWKKWERKKNSNVELTNDNYT